jgi:uncharacterized membrane protein
VGLILAVHLVGVSLLLGGITAQLLLRPRAGRAAAAAQHALYDLAWQIRLLMVDAGLVITLITGIWLWLAQRLPFLTGWLLLGVLLFVAAAALEGAFLGPNLRRMRRSVASGETPQAADSAALTIQAIAWFLVVVVLFLMAARPF